MQIYKLTFKILDSTHLFAKRSWENFPQDALTVIIAEQQTQGIGRNRRAWVSLPGKHLYLTMAFRWQRSLGVLGQLLALSTADVLRALKLSLQVKFPNDLQLEGKKVGGVLVDVVGKPGSSVVIASLGLNVDASAEEIAEAKIGQPATSLGLHLKTPLDPHLLGDDVSHQFLANLELLDKSGFLPFQQKLNDLLTKKNEIVTVKSREQVYHGVCQGIGSEGELLLQLEDGTVRRVFAGELM